jgi:acetyl esterase/lipase
VPGGPASVPAFFSGWLTGELAPHLAAVTALDTAWQLGRRHGTVRDPAGLLAAGVSLAGYGALINRGLRAGREIEDALVEALGADYRAAIRRDPLPDDAGAPVTSLATPFRMRDVRVTRTRSLPYAPGGRRFHLDVVHPREIPKGGAPILLHVHGGAWVIGQKQQQGIPLMVHMAARDWICFDVNYPLSPRARWPEHLVALKRSIAWIREHAVEYGADPSFLAVTGGSAGGHLAAMLALSGNDPTLQPGFEDADTSVQACVPMYGMYDFTDESGTKHARQRLSALIRPMVMGRKAKYPDDYRAASPLYRVSSDAPPFLVVHGRNDTLIPVADARAFVAALRAEAKSPVGYAELPGAPPAFDVFLSIRSAGVVRGAARFLEWAHATRDDRMPPD